MKKKKKVEKKPVRPGSKAGIGKAGIGKAKEPVRSRTGSSREELLALARKAGIRGRSRMTKDQLASALGLTGKGAPAGVSSAPAAAPSAKAVPESPFPAALGVDRAILLPRDPRAIFLYWEVTGEAAARGRAKLGEKGEFSVRLLEGGEGGSLVSEGRPVGPIGSWYFHLPRPEMEVVAQVGLAARNGGFLALLTTNRVRLPRESPSVEEDTLWMTRWKELMEIFRISGAGAVSGASPSVWRFADLAARAKEGVSSKPPKKR